MRAKQIEEITDLIAEYAKEHNLVPFGHQLHVSLEIKPAPPIPIVVISGAATEQPNVPLSTLRLSARVFNALNNEDITTVSKLFEFVKQNGSTRALTRLRNFGGISLKELKDRLKGEGFTLGPEWGD